MTSQLRIDGSEQRLDGLTPRQQLALDYIAERGPVSSDELGALLHEERLSRGGRGHHADARCGWCADEGKQMGAALRAKRLVKMRRGIGWVLPGYQHDRGLQTTEIPY